MRYGVYIWTRDGLNVSCATAGFVVRTISDGSAAFPYTSQAPQRVFAREGDAQRYCDKLNRLRA